MGSIQVNWVDYLILLTYFLFVVGIGVLLRRQVGGCKDFLESGRALPAWVCALGFIGANLGAQEVMGMAASGAKYGIMTCHFYWIGAIPAMVFVGVMMMPFYYGSKARSVPEYLRLRFDEKTRTFNALTFAAMTVLSSGISMYGLAIILEGLVGWNFHVSILLSGVIVLAYILMGGLTSAIYNEVMQFFLIVFGFLPITILGLIQVGGWEGLVAKLDTWAATNGYAAGAWTSSWADAGTAAANPMGVEWFGVAMGLGFVLSFGYWCTDFLVVQRAMAAENMSAARRTPLIAAFPKMLMPFLVILPGLVAAALLVDPGSGFALPKDASGSYDYNKVVPLLLGHYLPNGMLGLGLTALMASFMSGMAGNVTAFNTIWTYDLYQTHIRPKASDDHYLHVARWTTVVGIAASMVAAYAAAKFNNIMDMLQLIFAFVNAPLFATFLLGMFWRRTTANGAFWGLIAGTASAALHHALTVPAGAATLFKGGWSGTILHTYPSDMAQNFWTAIFAWTACFLATILISIADSKIKKEKDLVGLVYSLTPRISQPAAAWWLNPAILGGIVLACAVVLNILFW